MDLNSQITGFNVSSYGIPQSSHVKDDVSEFGPCETIENWQIRSTTDWKRNRDVSNYFGVGVPHNWQDRQNEDQLTRRGLHFTNSKECS